MYLLKNKAPKCMKQTLTELKRELNNLTIINGGFKNPLSIMVRTTRLKVNKEIENLKNTINQPDLADIYKILHSTITEYTFISCVHGMVSRTDHVLGHKTSLDNFKRSEIISSMFSDHNGMEFEIHNRRKFRRFANL